MSLDPPSSPAVWRGWPLTLARAAWVFIAGVSVTLVILHIPISVRGIYSDWRFQETYPVVAGFLPGPLFAAYTLTLGYAVTLVCWTTAGLIAWRKADDRTAWLTAAVLVMTPVMFSLGGDTSTWPGYPSPWRELLRWTRETLTWVGGATGITALFFVFPNGRCVPAGMRWVAGLAIALELFLSARLFLGNGGELIYSGWLITFLGALGAAMAGQLYRYRRISSPTERQQTKWVVIGLGAWVTAFAAGTALTLLAAGTAYAGLTVLITGHTQMLALAGLPLTLAFSIFRYRLWNITPLLNRALVYGGLMACILGLYALIVGGLGALFRQTGSELLAILAAGVAAVLFQPLRARLQRLVNRLWYGERDDPATALARLGRRLEAALAPDAVLPTIVETVAQALKSPYVAITLAGAGGDPAAARGVPPAAELISLPLVYQSEAIGQLWAAPRAPGESFTPVDQRLLGDLARQAAPAVHAYRLTADLQRSRERLVVAREEERRRLRRNLHDGLGPALASQALKLDAALELWPTDPAAATRYLSEVKAQSQATIADIRRLVYDLRPPALDDLGLAGALRAHLQALPPANGLHVTLEAPPAWPPLPAAVEAAAYRIVLEALTNVVKHARASACVIRLALRPAPPRTFLDIEVVDNGVGLPAAYAAGVGLISLRERAEELGGQGLILNHPPGGVQVLARLPLG